jgi:nucleotide-binding universal stress UspA family protein
MKVLLAIDGSAHSHAAVCEVAARAWPKDTAVEILTVIHSTAPLAIDPAFVLAAIHVDQTGEQRHVAPALVEAAARQIAARAPELSLSTKILEGMPQDVILEEARDWNADLIVLGSHGYGRLKRLVLGSVAGAVVARAPCSVHVVRAKHLVSHAESAA